MLIEEKPMYYTSNSHLAMSAVASNDVLQNSNNNYKGLDNRRLEKVINYINANISTSITLKTLAEVVSLSDFHFSRLFKARLGKSPLQYVNEQRLLNAKHFLVASRRSITWIAYELGYQDTSYFSNKFKRTFGVSPSEYRKLNRVIV